LLMSGVWKEDGSYEFAPGEFQRLKKGEKGKGKDGKGDKGKGKGDKGKDKGKGKKGKGEDKFLWEDDGPDAKRARTGAPGEPFDLKTFLAKKEEGKEDEEEELPEFDFEKDWKDKLVTLLNLKGAKELNGLTGHVKEYNEDTKRFKVLLQDGKGEKSIKMENIFKVMTGSLVKLRGLESTELNEAIAECGKLNVETMRYDVTLSDGRHVKVKPSNVDFVAYYEATKVAGDATHMERVRAANGLRDRLDAIEEFQLPTPQVIPVQALEEYSKKFPKAVVIGRSNAANPKGAQILAKEVITAKNISPGSRLIFVSMPRDRCVAPALAEMRHDELLRLGKFAGWVEKRLAPRPVYFLLPGTAAKGPPSVMSSATCAWPLYVELCTDLVILESDRWQKSPWSRMDALVAVWARTPMYLLPEKYSPAVALPDASPAGKAASGEDDAKATSSSEPLSFRPEEPFTICRPTEGLSTPSALLVGLTDRAAEAEGAAGAAKVQKPTLAVKRLG